MSQIRSYAGQTHRTALDVVEQPALLKSGQKALKWWAGEDGLIWCVDPNKPDKKPTYSQPLDALRRVAMGIKIFVADMDKDPKAYLVDKAVLWNFFNEFKSKVFDKACAIDDNKNDSILQKINKSYAQAKKEAGYELKVEASKYENKKSTIFVSPKSLTEPAVPAATKPKKARKVKK